MRNLSDFPPPNDGEVTLCEIDGRVHSMNYEFSNISAFTNIISKHPIIHITRDLLHPAAIFETSRELFLPVDEPFLKRFVQTLHSQGLIEALSFASKHRQFFVSKTASTVLFLLNATNKLQTKLNFSAVKEVAQPQLAQTKNWSNSTIRCIAWHSFNLKIAVASLDDSVRIFTSDQAVVPVLKSKQQRNISCLAWRPLSNSELAVGCEDGIIVWDVDPFSVVARPSINNAATILYRVNHTPVIALAWSPGGDLLASAVPYDNSILVWNVELDETSTLKRRGSSGHALLKWSADGSKMFSASTGLTFRVWNCSKWESERWTLPAGRVQSACWSPCGRMLLFTTTAEPVLYALSFIRSELVFAADSRDSPNLAIPVFDFTRVDVEGYIVGGLVQQMDWDPHGSHLAVIFRESKYVAVFSIILRPTLQINASLLIAGTPEEVPNCLEFQKNFESGACLSIGWSSGRLQHFPITYQGAALSHTVLQTIRDIKRL